MAVALHNKNIMNMSKKSGDRNIKNTCRVCLDAILSDFVILQPGNNWLEQYEYCFDLTVKENDEPRKLCLKCAENMKEFVNFKKKCHNSHDYWKAIEKLLKANDVVLQNCYPDNCKVKEEIEEPLVKEENINEENPSNNFDEIVEKLNETDDHFEDSINYQYDESIEDETTDDKVPKIENTERIVTRGHRKYSRKAKNHCKGSINYQYDESIEDLTTDDIVPKIGNSEQIVTKVRRKYNRKAKDKEVLEFKSNSHPCGLCDFNSTDLQETLQHLKEHGSNKELTCKICKYEGFDFADMIIHRYEHMPKGRSKHCPECSKRFLCSKRLQFHYRVHAGGRGGRCAECGATFAVYKTLRKHEKLRHENGRRFICDHCGIAFLYRNQIIEHLDNVAGLKRVICDTCGSSFNRSSYLKLHMRTVHKNDAVKCDHCGVTYKNKYRLQHHLKLVAKKKEFVCKICSKAFHYAVALKEHEFWHTGEKPFSCEICGKTLKKKGELKIHIERHMGIRRFKCTVCSKDFVTSTQLKVHGAVHTGVRRHKCPHCERSFHAQKLLMAHCLSKHNIELGNSG